MELLKKVRETIKKYSMLSKGDSVLIGLSGGPDSVCLTSILVKLRKDFNLSLNAVYIDHGLRPDEVESERMFCEKLCGQLGIDFLSRSIDVRGYAGKGKLNLHDAARELRYQIFEEISGDIHATKICLAHNADDQAETFFMRLLRGAGQKGFSGIPPVRGIIIRPFIEIERKEIEEYLASAVMQPFMIDSSNLKQDYLRNWVRQVIIPELQKQNPALIRTIGRAADIFREEDAYLETLVNKALMRLISRKKQDALELFLFPLVTMEKPLLRRVLRRAFDEVAGLRGIDFTHVEDVIKLIKTGGSGDMVTLPKGFRAIKGYATLMLTTEFPLTLKSRDFNPPGELVMEECGIVLKAEVSDHDNEFNGKDTAVFDFNKLYFPLTVRKRQKGDYFYPSGFGRKKKLQDFFVDEKIKRYERDRVPIVLSGNDIIWVAGYRADERFMATGRTEKFLKLIISNT